MDNLISKKDLLAATGISYGQLYRWKREGLIPEEWFNKQSSFTGQETFFPREEILARISSILAMKDNHSLEELANILSTGHDARVSPVDVAKLGSSGQAALEALGQRPTGEGWTLGEIAFAYGLLGYAEADGVPKSARKELVALIRGFAPSLGDMKLGSMTCTLFRASGALRVALCRGTDAIEFDPGIVVLARLPLGEIINMLKKKLTDGEPAGTEGEN
jgi:hypothetical protein